MTFATHARMASPHPPIFRARASDLRIRARMMTPPTTTVVAITVTRVASPLFWPVNDKPNRASTGRESVTREFHTDVMPMAAVVGAGP